MLSEGDIQPMTRGTTTSGITLVVRSGPKRTPTATPGKSGHEEFKNADICDDTADEVYYFTYY